LSFNTDSVKVVAVFMWKSEHRSVDWKQGMAH